MPYPSYPAVNVPNVPTPRLEHYLDFWESERDAARSIQSPAWAATPYHAEWDINVPVPKPWFFRPGGEDFLSFAGIDVQSRELRAWSAGSGMRAVGQPLGQDPTALVNRQASTVLVTATWAQRAANAFLATVGGAPIEVDGIVGTATLGALRTAMLHFYRMPDTGQTNVGGVPVPARSGSGVSMPIEIGNWLSSLTQVADPPPRVRPPSPPPTTTAPATPPPDTSAPMGSASSAGFYLLAALGIGVFAFSRR